MSGLRLGIAQERQTGFAAELASGVAAVATEWGWSHHAVNDAGDEARSDIVLAIGDLSIYPDLVGRPRLSRRILWHGETLPRRMPESGGRIHDLLPTGRLLDVAGAAVRPLRRASPFVHWREQAAIVREPLHNLNRLRRRGHVFDRLVIDAHDRAEGAIRAGLTVDVVPYGYHAAYAGRLEARGERPIQVLSLAHIVGRYGRRQRLLTSIEAQLAESGIPIARVGRGSFGDPRRRLLEQTRIVIDVHRLPGNHPGFRFIVAAAAGAALVCEPLARPEPLVPGVHYVEARAEAMAEAVRALLADEPRRQRIVAAARDLLSDELDMHRVLPLVLAR